MHNIHKFYGWLEVNINTPIEVKLLVLYSGVFLLYFMVLKHGEILN